MKPLHGAPIPKNVPGDMVDIPPVECGLRAGDVVTYTNDYGVKFLARVRGFRRELRTYGHRWTGLPSGRQYTETVTDPNFIYLEFWRERLNAWATDGSAWWSPHKPESLRKDSA